ncbi:MAG: hypothetical protein ABL961_18135 [Vicinamibacterales bacterium]
MSKKIADLGGGLVTLESVPAPQVGHTLAPRPAVATPTRKPATAKLRKAGFLVHPTALRQFDVLKAERGGDDRKNAGVRLIHEALNLLFEKHGKPVVRLDI